MYIIEPRRSAVIAGTWDWLVLCWGCGVLYAYILFLTGSWRSWQVSCRFWQIVGRAWQILVDSFAFIWSAIYTNSNIPELQKYNFPKNTNYLNYINNGILFILFWNVSIFTFSKVFWNCWSILYNKLLLWISYSDSVNLTLYGSMV